MESVARFPYQRLRYGGRLDEEAEEEERASRRIRNFSRFKFRGINKNRRRLKLRIPGLRKFLRKRPRFLSRVRVSWRKAWKKLKNGQAHMNDLFGGNFLVMQVGPAPFEWVHKPYMSHVPRHRFPVSKDPSPRFA